MYYWTKLSQRQRPGGRAGRHDDRKRNRRLESLRHSSTTPQRLVLTTYFVQQQRHCCESGATNNAKERDIGSGLAPEKCSIPGDDCLEHVLIAHRQQCGFIVGNYNDESRADAIRLPATSSAHRQTMRSRSGPRPCRRRASRAAIPSLRRSLGPHDVNDRMTAPPRSDTNGLLPQSSQLRGDVR